MGGELPVKIRIDHTGLDHHETVFDVDLKNLVHPAHIHNQAAPFRYRQTCQGGPGPPWNDRKFLLACQCHNGGHVLSIDRPDGRFGPMSMFRCIL